MDSPAPRFDSNRAWQQASAAIRANREVLLALAGVFFLLPNLAFALLFPQPVPPAGADQKEMMTFALNTYSRMLPFIIPVMIMQAAGTLGMLTLLTDRARPTVGEAIRTGFGAVLPYLASQIVLGFVLGIAALPIMILFTVLGGKALATVALLAVFVVWIYVWVRTVLAAPVMAIEGLRNPIAALLRSWRLTRTNALRIFIFVALITLAFTVVLMVASLLLGMALNLLLPAEYALIGTTLLSATLSAAMVVTLVAALGATHTQLTEGKGEANGDGMA